MKCNYCGQETEDFSIKIRCIKCDKDLDADNIIADLQAQIAAMRNCLNCFGCESVDKILKCQANNYSRWQLKGGANE